MSMDPDYGDGLLNVSGDILRQEVRGQIKSFLRQEGRPAEILLKDEMWRPSPQKGTLDSEN